MEIAIRRCLLSQLFYKANKADDCMGMQFRTALVILVMESGKVVCSGIHIILCFTSQKMAFRDYQTELASKNVRGPLDLLNMREEAIVMVFANVQTSIIFASASVG